MNTWQLKLKKNGWILLAGGFLLAGLCGTVCAQAQSQEPASGKTVEAKKFQRLMKKKNAVLLDVRTIEEYKEGHIPGSQQIDVLKADDFKARIAALDKNKTYLLYCRSGKRSRDAMEILQASGFPKLYDLEGGFTAWPGKKEK